MNNKINHALIMAAGRGIRMRPLTDDIPKAMAPFNGSTLIAEGIKELRQNITNIHITVGYKKDILSSHLMLNNVDSIINTNDNGNCWWIFNSLMKNLNQPIFVLTCDNVLNLNFTSLEKIYFQNKMPDCMIIPTKPVDNLDGDYIEKDQNNLITYIGRSKKTNLMCSGVQILNPNRIFLNYSKTDNFYSLWNEMISKKTIICADFIPTYWYAVDNIDQLNKLNLKYKNKN